MQGENHAPGGSPQPEPGAQAKAGEEQQDQAKNGLKPGGKLDRPVKCRQEVPIIAGSPKGEARHRVRGAQPRRRHPLIFNRLAGCRETHRPEISGVKDRADQKQNDDQPHRIKQRPPVVGNALVNPIPNPAIPIADLAAELHLLATAKNVPNTEDVFSLTPQPERHGVSATLRNVRKRSDGHVRNVTKRSGNLGKDGAGGGT